MAKPPRDALIALIRVYQFFSRMTPRRCRFHPTCSQYAVDALARFGLLRGTGLALKRLGRCHPWNPGGYDPVPEPPDAIPVRPPKEHS